MTSDNASGPHRPTPLDRSHFTAFQDIPTRWMDVDIYGHVNNVQYLSFFDTAVNGWYISNQILDPANSNSVFLVAETSCHYFSELMFPGIVSAGLRIEKLGRSSIVFNVGLFSGNDPSTAAHGQFVHVHVDRENRRPVPIPDEMRSVLDQLVAS